MGRGSDEFEFKLKKSDEFEFFNFVSLLKAKKKCDFDFDTTIFNIFSKESLRTVKILKDNDSLRIQEELEKQRNENLE